MRITPALIPLALLSIAAVQPPIDRMDRDPPVAIAFLDDFAHQGDPVHPINVVAVYQCNGTGTGISRLDLTIDDVTLSFEHTWRCGGNFQSVTIPVRCDPDNDLHVTAHLAARYGASVVQDDAEVETIPACPPGGS